MLAGFCFSLRMLIVLALNRMLQRINALGRHIVRYAAYAITLTIDKVLKVVNFLLVTVANDLKCS